MAGFSQPHELPLEQGIQNISVADVDASRRRIDNFLSSHSVYEILPDSGKVFFRITLSKMYWLDLLHKVCSSWTGI